MSGAEVGLALAVLPLLISAAEHYEDCIRPFSRFKNFSKEVDRFRKLLRNQKTIFRNQCLILLKEIVDDNAASSVLNGACQEKWPGSEIEGKLVQLLGDSREACATTIGMIEERLGEIEAISQEFGSTVDRKYQVDHMESKDRKRGISGRLRFSFSTSRLDRVLSDLRLLNDDFRILSDQILRAECKQDVLVVRASYQNPDRELEKYNAVGQASRQVYEALGKACTKHTEHQAHFCIEAEQAVAEKNHVRQVKFHMAFTHLKLSGKNKDGELIWFIVDSTTGDAVELRGSDIAAVYRENGTCSLKRQIELATGPSSKKVKKSVRFDQSAIMPSLMSALPAPISANDYMSNESMRKDFCDYIRGRLRHPREGNECVCVLDNTGNCRQSVYLSSTKHNWRQAFSLEELISETAVRQKACKIPLYERLRLAKTLAIAVLQYHATPWLTTSWRSEDVYFFGEDVHSVQDMTRLTPPHLIVNVKSPNGQSSRASAIPNNDFVRNPLLFSLGVILLEIAHASTLGSLKRPCDLQNGRENQYTEFFAARRLAKAGNTDMGGRYHKIVERLVECDFACGADLSDPQLQSAFHNDVISPLEELERTLKELHFGY